MLCLFTLLSFMLSCYIIFFYIYLFTYLLKILKKRDHPMVEITLILHAHQSFVLGFQKELEGVQ